MTVTLAPQHPLVAVVQRWALAAALTALIVLVALLVNWPLDGVLRAHGL